VKLLLRVTAVAMDVDHGFKMRLRAPGDDTMFESMSHRNRPADSLAVQVTVIPTVDEATIGTSSSVARPTDEESVPAVVAQ
jgi:hypothetical protein